MPDAAGEMPDRMIRDRARRSPTLQAVSDAAERAWWRLTVAADDYGRFEADPEVLLSELFPRRPRGWAKARMAAVLAEWEAVGLIHTYSNGLESRLYGHAVTWVEHQRPRDSKPKYPNPPCGDSPQSAAKCGESRQLAAPSEGRSSEGRSIGVSGDVARATAAVGGESPHPPMFRVPPSVLEALGKSPTLGAIPRLRTPAFWQAEVRANPGVDFAREVLKAEAWMQANPTKAPKRDFPRFVHTWLSRADREADDGE